MWQRDQPLNAKLNCEKRNRKFPVDSNRPIAEFKNENDIALVKISL
jgi:hypothetical protein